MRMTRWDEFRWISVIFTHLRILEEEGVKVVIPRRCGVSCKIKVLNYTRMLVQDSVLKNVL